MLTRLTTLYRLGPLNLLRVGCYRAARSIGWWRLVMPIRTCERDSVLATVAIAAAATGRVAQELGSDRLRALIVEADEILAGRLRLFGGAARDVGSPPRWHASAEDPSVVANPALHWSVSQQVGDVKNVWEPSRFTWAVILSRAFVSTGNREYLDALGAWIDDWLATNPVNAGVNWACGQEASHRVIHLLTALEILGVKAEPSDGATRFISEHLKRIASTTNYALGQDNNHGTSEAAALMIGGAWLARSGVEDGQRYRDRGRKMLEERVERLVMADGSFAQYSVNYHRLLLDTLSIAEVWRRKLGEPEFSQTFRGSARAATLWLYEMTDESSGAAPNIGNNDGARILGLSSAPFADYRPSVELAAMLFCGAAAYRAGTADEPLMWLGLARPAGQLASRSARVFRDGGWATLHAPDGGSWACVRFPHYRFRPAHADALHLDIFCDGVNVVRDGGTGSYHTVKQWDYFRGTSAHNTVQFGDRDQMRSIGRFLFGDWLEANEVSEVEETEGAATWSGSYIDRCGASHKRTVTGRRGSWSVVDEVDAVGSGATLRWRLLEGDYALRGDECIGERLGIRIEGSSEDSISLSNGRESCIYSVVTPAPVLEVVLPDSSVRVTSTISLGSPRATAEDSVCGRA